MGNESIFINISVDEEGLLGRLEAIKGIITELESEVRHIMDTITRTHSLKETEAGEPEL